MWEYALTEVFWVFIVIGIPMLLAYGRVWYNRRKARKYRDDWDRMMNNLSIQTSAGYQKGYADELARQRQVRKDDHIFNTIEEYRNDVG